MPTAVGPNTKGEENLVFGYDLGDTRNSYKGEPTTNFMPTVYQQGATSSGTDEIGSYFEGTITRIGCPNVTYIDSGATYTFTIEIRASQTFNMSADSNQYAPENAGNDNNRVSVTYIRPNYTTPNEWVKYSTTVVMKSGLTNPYMFDFFIPVSFTGRMYYRNAQLEYKPHATPFTPSGTTRSVSGSLIDLTGNSTIDLTNVSFDSNAQIDFDGTSDYIELEDGTKWFTDQWSYEFVFKSDSNNGTYQGVLWGEGAVQSGYSGYQKLFALYNHSYFHYRIHNSVTSWTNTNYTPSNYTPTNYNHIVWQFANGTTNIAINGEIVHTDSSRGTYNGGTSSPLFIGARNDLNYELNGQIPYLKRYSRPLTASEIKANYNAIKGRFNI